MQTLLWILAFIGVALIYVVPYVGNKLNFSNNLIASLKLTGVLLSAISLIILFRTGGLR